MKAIELWEKGSKPTLSFEFFPPRSEKGAENLVKVIDKLSALNPDFVSVTFGAGGSTREGSKELVDTLQNKKNLEVIAYFAGYGLSPDTIKSVLNDYQDIGVSNLLVVRGDPPKDEIFQPHPESLQYACDLIHFIKPQYSFYLGAAGYPEGHIKAPSIEKDIEFLKMKIDNGAEFIFANYFYDNRYFFNFLNRCNQSGISVPIIPGVMPIYSIKMLKILAGLCGATITDEVHQGLSAIPEDDKESLNNFGIEFAFKQCADLLKSGVPGLHFYTMDRSKSVVGVVSSLRQQGLL